MARENVFITGIEEKYPPELLKGRIQNEANLVACLCHDIMLVDEIRLDSKAFVTSDAIFYFGLLKDLRKHKINTLDEVSILSNCNELIINGYEDRGGWHTVQMLMDGVDPKNYDSYLDTIYRENNLFKLYNDGFSIDKEINFNGKKINSLSLFRKMTNEELMEFYEGRLTQLDCGNSSKILEETNLELTDEWLESVGNGLEAGIPFDRCINVETGEKIKMLKDLSGAVGGYKEGTLNFLGGFSSSGKSTIFTYILLSLASQGRKTLIISNEQKSTPFKTQFLMTILVKFLNYNKLTKKRLEKKRLWTDEDKQMLHKAMRIWNEQFSDKFKFIHIADSDITLAKKKIREYHLIYGYDTYLYDTFKIDFENLQSNQRTDLSLIKDSRELDKIAKQYNMIGLASVQLGESFRGKLFLDASVLSNSKQVKEILETLILMRSVYSEELDKDNKKMFCHPFKRKTDSNGKWIDEDVEIAREKVYRMIFCEKTRSGASSNDDGVAYLLQFNGGTGRFEEVCLCRPKHITIQ